MLRYYAITLRDGKWVLVSSGIDPQEVYVQAVQVLQGQEAYPDEETLALSPATEMEINHLRVVSEEAAREVYHVNLPLTVEE